MQLSTIRTDLCATLANLDSFRLTHDIVLNCAILCHTMVIMCCFVLNCKSQTWLVCVTDLNVWHQESRHHKGLVLTDSVSHTGTHKACIKVCDNDSDTDRV